MEPTHIFTPFGHEGPKVVLYGKLTGDWNLDRLQRVGDHVSASGLYYRLNRIAQRFQFRELLAPIPTDCNTIIEPPANFPTIIQSGVGSLKIKRGVRADGMIVPQGLVGAIASADCPTIITYCPITKCMVVAHGGSKSLVDTACFLYKKDQPRQWTSIVDNVVHQIKEYRFRSPQVFVTCGIRFYEWPLLASYLSSNGGRKAVSGGIIDLKVLISEQFGKHGINNFTADIVDTHDDKDKAGEHLWHSYRRGETSAEREARNLVLVVNK